MNENSKISVGLLIPAVSVIAFVSMLFSENYIAALFVAVSGLMVWFAYSAIMNTKMPDVTGNIVIVFGIMLSLAFFMNYGLSTSMFGGFEIMLEGVVGSILILFFTVLLGVLFNNNNVDRSTMNASASQASMPQAETQEQPIASGDESEKEDDEYEYDEYGDYSDYDNMEDLEDYYYGDEYEEEYEN